MPIVLPKGGWILHLGGSRGDTIFTCIPVVCLFQILNLFAHLFDEYFDFHGAAGDFRVDRF